VRPFINCCGIRTLFGGGRSHPKVREAMAAVGDSLVDMNEMMDAAGARLGELTVAEWGAVTSGGAAGLLLATLACVVGNDPVRILRLPRIEDAPNRIVIPHDQRFAYDAAMRMPGTEIVEVSDIASLNAALADNAAMVSVLGRVANKSAIPFEEIVKAARAHGVPIMVDAASERLQSPEPWLARGADLVVYSGGKYLRGPQNSGLLLGRKSLVEAAIRNSAPHHGFARPMKVPREIIVGMIAAVEASLVGYDLADDLKRWAGDLDSLASVFEGHNAFTCSVIEPRGASPVPRIRITWERGSSAMTGADLRATLLAADRRILLDDITATENSVTVDPFNLLPGEAEIVGAAILSAVRSATPAAPAAETGVPADIGGKWVVDVSFLHGTRSHSVHFEQSNAVLSGSQTSPAFSGPVTGEVTGSTVRFIFTARVGSLTARYEFSGTVENGRMHGEVRLGASNGDNHGIVNFSQYGSGQWSARHLP